MASIVLSLHLNRFQNPSSSSLYVSFIFLTFSVAASVLILRALFTPKEADGVKATAGAAKKRVAIASFMVDNIDRSYVDNFYYDPKKANNEAVINTAMQRNKLDKSRR